MKGESLLRRLPGACAAVCMVLASGRLAADETLLSPTGIAVSAADWPWWRGPTLDGKAAGPAPPTRWSQTENVVWAVEVPGRGHASPCIWGRRIFISTAVGEEGELKQERTMPIFHPSPDRGVQSLLCYDRTSGKLLWKTDVHHGDFPRRHDRNSHATSTPACDGQRVIVVYPHNDAVWVTALDLEGKILWQKEAGRLEGRYGYGASPLCYRSLVIVSADHLGQSYIKAFDRATGRLVWEKPRKTGYSFSSPVVARMAGRDQLLLSGNNLVTSYEPSGGEVLWTCPGPANTTASTMAWLDDLALATGGDPQTGITCIRGDGRGDVGQSHVAWQNSIKDYVPSPLVVEDRLLVVKDTGVAMCFAARTGQKLWEERLRGGGFSASPVLAGGLVWVPNEAGRMFVFKAGRQFEPVAENDLADGGFASPAICGGQLFLRTLHHLYCIGR
ncbi:MAG: PQQ-binding-like beta-propeller repeat protein [Thermoguttaceae bacterium]